MDNYTVLRGQSISDFYGSNNGPVKVTSTNLIPIITSTRVLYGGISYSEMMGFPTSHLAKENVFPFYNNVAMNSQLRVSNVDSVDTQITVYIGTNPNPIDSFALPKGQATRRSYQQNNGPLRVTSSVANILTTIRVLYGGVSYSELTGFPADQLTTDYVFPFYNNVAMNSQLRVSNVDSMGTTINVYIGSSPTPIDTFPLAAGQAFRKNYDGLNSGPLRISSTNANILTTIRVLYSNSSFSELMGFPANQLTKAYSFPIYNNVSLNSQLRVSNLGNVSTTIKVYSGSNPTPIDSFSLPAKQASRTTYAQNSGPLRVVSDTTYILTTVRLLYNTPSFSSFYEITGFPQNQLNAEYWFPWYNNLAMNSELRLAVP